MTAGGIAAGALVVLTLSAAVRVAAQAFARIDIRRNRYDYHEIHIAAEFAAMLAQKEALDRRLDAVRDVETAVRGHDADDREFVARNEVEIAALDHRLGESDAAERRHLDRVELDRRCRLAAAERWHRRIYPLDCLLLGAATVTAVAAAVCGLALAFGVL